MCSFTIKAPSFILTKEEAAPEKKTNKKGFRDAEMLKQPVRDLKSTLLVKKKKKKYFLQFL